MKSEHSSPGARVSVDHFESRLLGRTRDSFGKESSNQYKGGCVFVDHGTGYLHVEHQLGFSAVETICAKQSFENMAFEHGVVVQSYLTDSGAFKANTFVQHICDHSQEIKYCGTNAHHQNGITERSIRTVSNMARAMLLHSASHWKEGINSTRHGARFDIILESFYLLVTSDQEHIRDIPKYERRAADDEELYFR